MVNGSFFGLSDNKLQVYKVKVQEDFSVLCNNRTALVKQLKVLKMLFILIKFDKDKVCYKFAM